MMAYEWPGLEDQNFATMFMIICGGFLLLLLILPILWASMGRVNKRGLPWVPKLPQRPARGRQTDSQGIRCHYCNVTRDSDQLMDWHHRFECPGLGR